MESKELEEEAILAALMGISEMMGDLTEIDELLDAIVRIAPRLVLADRCAIFLRNPRAPEFRVTHAFSADPPTTALLMRVVLPEAHIERLTHKLIRQRVPVLLRVGRDPLLPPAFTDKFRIRSMLLVPLEYQGQVMGFMTLDQAGQDHVFTSREVNVVGAIASHAAVALVHTRLVDAYRLERRRNEALAGALCDGVITLDPQLRVASMNAGAEVLLGWTAEGVQDRPCGDVLGDGMLAAARRVLSGAVRDTAVVPVRARDGSYVACLVTGASVPGAPGVPAEVLLALTRVDEDDVTTRHPGRTGGDSPPPS